MPPRDWHRATPASERQQNGERADKEKRWEDIHANKKPNRRKNSNLKFSRHPGNFRRVTGAEIGKLKCVF